MPIRFRCTYCNRLLGIATRKAGTETTCPHCGYAIMVPVPNEDDGKTERINVDDIEAALGNHVTERVAEPVTQVLEPPRADAPKPAPPKSSPPPSPKAAAPKPRENPPPVPRGQKAPANPNDPPLFEADWDEIFGKSAVALEPDPPKPPTPPGRDAMSLGEPSRVIVLSATKATLLMGGVVVLLAVAFAAGYFVAR